MKSSLQPDPSRADYVPRLRAAPDPSPETPEVATSGEPATLLASLLTVCVPHVCDSLMLTVTDADAAYCVTDPRGARGTPPERPHHALEIPFTHESTDTTRLDGLATFGWRQAPTEVELHLAAVLLDNAVRTMHWQRSEQRARAAETQADNLREGLRTSRLIGMAIGILMSLHKISGEEGFDLLARASQHLNRKLRDIAVDVVETGWLDPAQQPGPERVRAGAPGPGG